MKKKYKICFISPKAYPIFSPACTGVFGGAEVDLYYLATELAKDQDYEVTCIVADYGQNNNETIENVKLIKSLTFHENQLAGAIKIWQAMKAADADFYMLESASPGVVLAGLFCRKYKKKLVYRTANSEECDGRWINGHGITGRLFGWTLKKAFRVIVQNNSETDAMFNSLGIETLVIANGHPIPELNNTSRSYILWAGRSTALKQPQLFLELAAACPEFNFVMICPQATDDLNYPQLKEQAAKISNIKFIERVPFHQIGDYFNHALAFVSTSSSEGFPNTFIQACITGTPIVSLNVNPDEFLTKYHCGICVTNPTQLTQALKNILTTRELFSISATNYAREKHDLKKIITDYKNIFR